LSIIYFTVSTYELFALLQPRNMETATLYAKLFLGLINYRAMKLYEGVEVYLQLFITAEE